jgi:hypothetical protein
MWYYVRHGEAAEGRALIRRRYWRSSARQHNSRRRARGDYAKLAACAREYGYNRGKLTKLALGEERR